MFFVLAPMRALAEDKKWYIDKVIIVAAENLKDAQTLAGSGYTVLSTPIYDGGEKDYSDPNDRVKKSWLCYKSTDDPTNAITEIRALNMNDNWDYDTYNEYLKKLKAEVTAEVELLADAVQEFRYNLSVELPKSEYVYKALQFLYDDESKKRLGAAAGCGITAVANRKRKKDA